jgi:hypothetical protein
MTCRGGACNQSLTAYSTDWTHGRAQFDVTAEMARRVCEEAELARAEIVRRFLDTTGARSGVLVTALSFRPSHDVVGKRNDRGLSTPSADRERGAST